MERERGGWESHLTPEKEKGKEEGKIGVCFQGLFGGISCFYYTVVFFRVFYEPRECGLQLHSEWGNYILMIYFLQI